MNSSKSLKNLLLLVLIALLLDKSSRLLRPLLRSLDYNVAFFPLILKITIMQEKMSTCQCIFIAQILIYCVSLWRYFHFKLTQLWPLKLKYYIWYITQAIRWKVWKVSKLLYLVISTDLVLLHHLLLSWHFPGIPTTKF